MSSFDFNTSEYKQYANNYEPVPAGNYVAIISSSEEKIAKASGNKMEALTFEITKGSFAGRKIFKNLNLYHSELKVSQIARGQLGKIGDCLGLKEVKDRTQILNKPLVIVVKIKKGEGQYGDQNEITSFKEYSRDESAKSDSSALGF